MASEDESKVARFVKTFLTCQHCKKRFERPVILLCSHSFCRGCLEDLIQTDETVTCPVCQDNILLPKKGIDAVKANTFIEFLLKYTSLLESFISSSESQGHCKLCEGDDITVYCQECAGAICKVCETQHERMKTFKGHSVMQIKDLFEGNVTDTLRMMSKGEEEEVCISHQGEPLRFFCQRCHIAVCRDCTVVDHNTSDHRVSALDEITDSRRRVLGDMLKSLNDKKKRNTEFIAGKVQIKQGILDQKAEVANAIENLSKEIIENIETQKKTLLDKLEKTSTARLMMNEKVFEAAETDHMEMNSCCSASALLLDTARDVDLLQVNGEFINAIKRQNAKMENTAFASQLARLGVVFKPQLVSDDFNIGSIDPVQNDQKVQSPSATWGGLEGSIRDFSTAFWNSLKE